MKNIQFLITTKSNQEEIRYVTSPADSLQINLEV